MSDWYAYPGHPSNGYGSTTTQQPLPYYGSSQQQPLTSMTSSYPSSSTSIYPPMLPPSGPYSQDESAYLTKASWREVLGVGTLEGELPLFEELGINFSHMKYKSLSILNPFRQIDKHIMDDTDLAGPVFFCLLLGAFLLLSGKLHFGYIYGVAVLGCFSVFFILNLMSECGIDGYRTCSVLGYGLLPMVILSSVSIFLELKAIWLGWTLGILAILWCTFSSSTMFVAVLSMREQRILIAYPIGLLYTCFALMTVF